MEFFTYKLTSIGIKNGNLIKEDVDAIICPANSFNQMRGGVAGVIRQFGGDIIEQEAMSQAPVPVGKAVITTGGTLLSKYVIHAPTMTTWVEKTDAEKVRKAVWAALNCAEINNLSRISFPGMGTGTGWFPYEKAAVIMLGEIKRFLEEEDRKILEINIVAYSKSFYHLLIDAANKIFKKP